jgi:Flp pilus assembly pilin Flp
MHDFLKMISERLSLDTEEGVAVVEYSVIAGIVIAGMFAWLIS